MKDIYAQNELQKEGKRLERAYEYELAKEKYLEAMKYDVILHGSDQGGSIGSLIRVLQKQERYEEALEKIRYVKKGNPRHEHYKDRERELESLVEYQKSGSVESLYAHIKYLKEKYKNDLPPISYDSILSVTVIDTILRLYDTIGDYDAGMKFIDEVLSYGQTQKSKRGEDNSIYDKVKTAQDAQQCMDSDWRSKTNERFFHACRFIREYLLVREAFEQDKAEGTRGRATKALIQSDYFPW